MKLFGSTRSKLLAATGTALLLAAAVGTLAAAGAGSPKASSPGAASGFAQSILKTERSQLAAAVDAGWLTKAQSAKIDSTLQQLLQSAAKSKLQAGDLSGLGTGGVTAAESYLGLSGTEIVSQLLGGKSLAEIASSQGKTGSGLVQAVVGAERPRLAAAVKAGQLTANQSVSIETGLQHALTNVVGAKLPAGSLGGLASGLLGGLGG